MGTKWAVLLPRLNLIWNKSQSGILGNALWAVCSCFVPFLHFAPFPFTSCFISLIHGRTKPLIAFPLDMWVRWRNPRMMSWSRVIRDYNDACDSWEMSHSAVADTRHHLLLDGHSISARLSSICLLSWATGLMLLATHTVITLCYYMI